MHYHLVESPTAHSPLHHKVIGLICLAVFLLLVGKIWLPYALAAVNAALITVLPPAWADSYIEATLPKTALAPIDNKIIINTPDLHIEAPLVEGIKPVDLLQGVGHDPASVKPGEQGRVVISGHRFWPDSSPWATVFFSLDRLKKDDIITLVYGGQSYRYKVIENWDVPKNQAYPQLGPSSQPILTIYTCGPTPYSAANRLGFNAVLDEAPLKEGASQTIQTLQEGVL